MVLLVVGVALFLLVWSRPHAPPPPPDAARPEAGSIGDDEQQVPGAESQDRQQAVPTDTQLPATVLHVVDHDGASLPGATIECVPPGRTIQHAAELGLAVGSKYSVANDVLAGLAATEPHSHIRARVGARTSPGVPIHRLLGQAVNGEVVLVVRMAHDHVVAVVDSVSRSGVGGAVVVLSATDIRKLTLERSLLDDQGSGVAAAMPGAGPSALYYGRTDADGKCTLRGLPAGDYVLSVRPAWPYAASEGPRDGAVAVPGPETEIRVTPMVAAALTFLGATVVARNAVPRQLSTSNLGQGQIEAERRRIEDAYPNTVAFVGFPKAEYVRQTGVRRPPPRVQFRVLLEGIGWYDREVDCQPIGPTFAPEQVDCRMIATRQAFGRLRVVPDSGNAAIAKEMLPEVVLEQGGRMPSVSVTVPWNETVSVPLGDSRLRFSHPLLTRLCSPTTVKLGEGAPSDQEVEISLPRGFLPVRLNVHDSCMVSLRSASFSFDHGGVVHEFYVEDPASTWQWLPKGKVTTRVTVRGRPESRHELLIGFSGSTIDVPVE